MPRGAPAGELGQPDPILAGVFGLIVQDLEPALHGPLYILFPSDPFFFGWRGVGVLLKGVYEIIIRSTW
jgi:hypothetical protein